MKLFNFKGLMVPVFTPFLDDKKLSINFEMIEKYGEYLKKHGMHGVMVNGFTGEGLTLRLEERKLLAEEWFKVTRKYQLVMLLNVGGASIADVYDMAEHAEKLGVDGILLLPDLFYRPMFEEDLIKYMKGVSKYCPNLPLLYYHMPWMTKVKMYMSRLYDMAEKEVPNFGGIFYADGNLDRAMMMMRKDRMVIMGMMGMMLGTYMMGIESMSMTAMNIMPDMMMELYENMRNMKMKEAMLLQEKILLRIREIYNPQEDMFLKLKMEFDKILKVGPMRKPELTMCMFRK